MDLSPFKLDIDELLKEFAEGELRTLSDMKKIWLRRKFSYIFEARLPNNLALFMQTLYSHSLSHMISDKSLSHRVGSLYCLYCLFETQPFNPPFKIYLSLGGLQGLRALVVVAKKMGIGAVPAIVKRMLEKNVFLFGCVDIDDYTEKESIKELVKLQNACIQNMKEKLLCGKDIKKCLHMDLGRELDLEVLTKISAEYARSKSLAIKEASQVVDVENVRHIAEERLTIGDEVGRINEEWGNQKEQLMLLPGTEQQIRDGEVQPGSFMDLIMSNEEDDTEDDDFVKDLESQLYEGL